MIFGGAGATAALNRLVALFAASERVPRPAGRLGTLSALLGRRDGARVCVIIGPYEHHSNILPWRESGAEVLEVGEAPAGGPDLAELSKVLAEKKKTGRVICAFSAASNITGIVTDVVAVTRIAKAAGALMVWDYAGGGRRPPVPLPRAAGARPRSTGCGGRSRR